MRSGRSSSKSDSESVGVGSDTGVGAKRESRLDEGDTVASGLVSGVGNRMLSGLVSGVTGCADCVLGKSFCMSSNGDSGEDGAGVGAEVVAVGGDSSA